MNLSHYAMCRTCSRPVRTSHLIPQYFSQILVAQGYNTVRIGRDNNKRVDPALFTKASSLEK